MAVMLDQTEPPGHPSKSVHPDGAAPAAAPRADLAGVQAGSAKTLVIIPALNEANRVGGIVRRILASLPQADVLVVDDGSSDGTARAATAAGARVVSLPFNLGYGAALQTGYKYALLHGYEFVLQIDADGQHEPDDLPALLAAVQSGQSDVAVGSRFLGGETYRIPFSRRVGMRIFATLASLLTGVRITDPTSGFQALNRRVVRFYASPAYPADYPDADVLVMLHFAGFRFTEVPARMYSRQSGASMHGGLRPIYYVYKMTLSILMILLRDRKPNEDCRYDIPPTDLRASYRLGSISAHR